MKTIVRILDVTISGTLAIEMNKLLIETNLLLHRYHPGLKRGGNRILIVDSTNLRLT